MKDQENPISSAHLSREDIIRLEKFVLSTGYMSPENTRRVIDWFLNDLGIDPYYFQYTALEEIGRHLIAISASELVSRYGGEGVGIQLMNEREDQAVYIVEEQSARTEEIEQRIETKYPHFRIQSYITRKKSGKHFLRLYIVTRTTFGTVETKMSNLPFEESADGVFLKQSAPETVARYRQAWETMGVRPIPYIAVSEKAGTNETRVMVGLHSHQPKHFLTNFSHLFYKYGVHSNRKYREVFRDGRRIYTFYFDRMDPATVEDFSRDLLGVIMLPVHAITRLFHDEIYSPHETIYAIAAASFTHQFLTLMTNEYATLNHALRDQPEALGILETLRLSMTKDAYSEERISGVVIEHHELVSELYRHFEALLHPFKRDIDPQPLEKGILDRIEKEVPAESDRLVLHWFLDFNRAIRKTNFFLRDKRGLAFHLDPSFLSQSDYPEKPFGLYFFVSREALGFHIRFRDIARGGIRIVKSRHHSQYLHNLNTIFLENYNLASTQQKKNKDIPEGGAKGTILLHEGSQNEEHEAFVSYIDAMLDLLVPEREVLDPAGKKEILFLGPDERTAELMNWAAVYARRRGYPYWKAFTTGKEPALGGIPHDMYGMTTAGVHQYVLGALEKLGLKEEGLTKLQTGGPDGDLGSNEILISRDRTIGVVDGSGVLYDPAGLDREELVRLARKRVMVEQFGRSLLSRDGFFVSVNDRAITLPDGTAVPNGEDFRNRFHLLPYAKADLFVPCGGRPAAININNWTQVLDERGQPKFRLIIEGANLFITEEARLRLEEKGVVLIKDASTNKGGVTSSALEVLASLALTDEQYDQHMVVRDGKLPAFRKAYIEEILRRVRDNARDEFELLWREHGPKGTPFTLLTNQVSRKINDITDAVVASSLADNPVIRQRVIRQYTPKVLLELVGLEELMRRVPGNYLKAIIGTTLATGFVYRHGLSAGEVDFYDYVAPLACAPGGAGAPGGPGGR